MSNTSSTPAGGGQHGSARPTHSRPYHALAVVLVVVAGLYLAVMIGAQHTPRLGLDLRGGTSVVLTATAPGGRTPSASALGQTVGILRNRLTGNGVSAAEVTTQGRNQVVVQVPGGNGQQLVTELLRSAQLRFRLVRELAPAEPGTSQAAATRRTEFAAGTPDSVVQQAFATLRCAGGAASATEGLDHAENVILACSQDAKSKFVLAPAGVAGRDISSAAAAVDQVGAWSVSLDFNSHGSNGWATLTGTAWHGVPPQACTGALTPGCNTIAVVLDGVVQSYPTVQNGPITNGQTQISGSFTEAEAKSLANILKYGALPVHLNVATQTTVSPTLGGAELRGGLTAGAIGLALVVVYLLLYYRALAFVAITSLGLSAGLLYALVTLLGESMGYTLTLAGIAGFIVAIGITADSFVVLFERLRDELREGRSVRSALRAAWPRARRTIISADTVSLLAAVILYVVSIGDIRGFAFTLGLSTICDLFVVVAFTYPVMTLMAQAAGPRLASRLGGLRAHARPGRATSKPRISATEGVG